MDADIYLEEGEIIDDDDDEAIEDCDDGIYTPLERPRNYSSALLQVRIPEEEQDTEEDVESSTDSDSDCGVKMKRPKLKLKPQNYNRNKKYDIWNTHVQEDVLLENLVNCDVSKVDRSRNVETYPLPEHVIERKTNKRTRQDRNNPNIRVYKKPNAKNENGICIPRSILDVQVTVESTEDDIAKDIANKLCEEKEDLILTIVKIAGKEKALAVFKETKRIEGEGGMLIMNQTRRRTPGGVFLFLIKHDSDLTRAQQCQIFQEERSKMKKTVRFKRKMKLDQIKARIIASRSASEQNVPELLSRADLCVQLIEKDKTRRSSDDIDVKNPPPSPVTDGHENSIDGIENINKDTESTSHRLINYDDDYLDVGLDMDLF